MIMAWDNQFNEKKRPGSSLAEKRPASTMTKVTNTDGSEYDGDGNQIKQPSRAQKTAGSREHGWISIPKAAEGYLKAQLPGLQDLLGGDGWPLGAIIGATGIGKSGKTTFCLQEAMKQAKAGRKVLYAYTESPRAKFMKIAHTHREELGLTVEQLEGMVFYDLHGSTLQNPKPQSIERYAGGFIVKELAAQMRKHKPDIIIIDSLTKLCRLWPAQAYYFVQQVTKGLWEEMAKQGLHPVVLCIMQKSGGHWEEKDATVLGGHGVGHELDGMIVFTKEQVDTWKHRELGLPMGSTLRLIRVDSLRDVDTDDSAHQLLKIKGQLEVGPTPESLRLEKMKQDMEAEEKKQKKTVKG
jgi:KaiC/GvpD/RAD55 family RecA-like ATPase